MWAGSRIVFHTPLRIGSKARRTTTLSGITRKDGRTGPLTFVELTHEIAAGGEIAITDIQDLVYREPPRERAAPGAATPAPDTGARIERWAADPVLLFRYSALTFNGHRIHYDVPYATDEEGYAGLVVHGPLIATLMAGAAVRHRNGATLASFEFRMLGPIFGGDPFSVHIDDTAEDVSIFVRDRNGAMASKGTARFLR